MKRTPYTPQAAIQDAVQANIARAKSIKSSEQRKADYYEGMADAYTEVAARIAGISHDDASEQVAQALEDLEK